MFKTPFKGKAPAWEGTNSLKMVKEKERYEHGK